MATNSAGGGEETGYRPLAYTRGRSQAARVVGRWKGSGFSGCSKHELDRSHYERAMVSHFGWGVKRATAGGAQTETGALPMRPESGTTFGATMPWSAFRVSTMGMPTPTTALQSKLE